MTDLDRQGDEILALTSIYEDLVTMETSNRGYFTAKVKIPDGGIKVGQHFLEYLPPIAFHFELPVDYPSTRAPLFSLECDWLLQEQLSELCDELCALWSPGYEVLYIACDYLCCGEFLLQDQYTPVEPSSISLQRLLSYDKKGRDESFSNLLHSCPVCLTDRLGSNCAEVEPCGHVICKDCLSNYLSVQIVDGDVDQIKCPTGTGCETPMYPHQIQALVTPELFSRYERLTLQRSLDSMADVTQCPRKACGLPVLLDSDGHMGRCPHCSLVFCSFCRLTYHGVEPCKMTADDIQKLLEEYKNDKDSEYVVSMKRKYGEKTINGLLQEAESLTWVKENSMPCPHCKAPIQKYDGCNKVVCTKCQTPMCWLCGQQLDRSSPYSHFSDRTANCYNRLFHGLVEFL